MPLDLFSNRTKRCPRCGRERERRDFYASRSSADGLQSYCKQCQREYRMRHPEKEWKQHHKDKYTLDIFYDSKDRYSQERG